MTVLAAFQIAGGIQVNTQTGPDTIECAMHWPGDPTWLWALEQARIEPEPPEVEDPAARLAAWRANASMPRSMFCIGLYRLGLLGPEDAIDAGKGNWPAVFDGALDAIPGVMDATEAKIIWATITIVERSDPLFEAMRAHLNITPEAADTLFGYIETAN